jgi:flagellar biogenesis protein FliO
MLDRLLGPEVPQFVVAGLALCAVLLLIVGLSWLARRAPGLLPPAPASGAGIMLRGTLRLDSRRRLHLVEIGGRQALVLTGGVSDVIVCLPPPGS